MKTKIGTLIRAIVNFVQAHTVASVSVASIVVATSIAVPVVLNLNTPGQYALEIESSNIQAVSSSVATTSTVASTEATSSLESERTPNTTSTASVSSNTTSAISTTSSKQTTTSVPTVSSTTPSQIVVPPKTGDIVYDGDYQYIYNYTPTQQGKVDKNDPYALWQQNPEQNGWGVHLMDGPEREFGPGVYDDGVGKKSYSAIKSEINSKPVVCADYLFQSCNLMTTSPVLPDTITSLFETYNGCTALKTAPTLPKGVTNLNRTFTSCISLTTVSKIPSTVKEMAMTFSYCTALKSAPTIPNGVTTLDMCFKECVSLTTAPVIPSSVADLSETFAYCTSLTGIITINSKTVKYVSNTYCFEGTEKPIVLTGLASKEILNTLAQSSFSGNITVNK